jgi:hypothetical protein
MKITRQILANKIADYLHLSTLQRISWRQPYSAKVIVSTE